MVQTGRALAVWSRGRAQMARKALAAITKCVQRCAHGCERRRLLECGLSRAGVMNESATAQGSQRARNELLCEVYK